MLEREEVNGKLLVNKMIIAQTIIYATPAADGVGIVAFINNINGGTIPNKIIQIISIQYRKSVIWYEFAICKTKKTPAKP